jgi:hypothetical protein
MLLELGWQDRLDSCDAGCFRDRMGPAGKLSQAAIIQSALHSQALASAVPGDERPYRAW